MSMNNPQEDDTQIPVPELLGVLLDMEGSDLHLTAGSPPVVRVHGDLQRIEQYAPMSPRALQGMIYAILPQKLRERFEQELELDMSYSLPGRARFRVNVYMQRDSIGAAFRVIPFEIKDITALGLPARGGRPRAVPPRLRGGHRPHRARASRPRSPPWSTWSTASATATS